MSATQISFAAFALSQFGHLSPDAARLGELRAQYSACKRVLDRVDLRPHLRAVAGRLIGRGCHPVRTPPVQEAAIAVVAHPLAVDGGECLPLPFEGLMADRRVVGSSALRPEYVDDWCVDRAGCGGMDAPEALPAGSHSSFTFLAGSPLAYVKANGFHGWLRC